MKEDIVINSDLIIPHNELDITTSKSGGAGGQHVNKTETRVTIRWNIKNSNALTNEQKEQLLLRLHSRITDEGDLLVSSAASRSQQYNKKTALATLIKVIRNALHIEKKRIATKISLVIKKARLHSKKHHSLVKKIRSKKHYDE